MEPLFIEVGASYIEVFDYHLRHRVNSRSKYEPRWRLFGGAEDEKQVSLLSMKLQTGWPPGIPIS